MKNKGLFKGMFKGSRYPQGTKIEISAFEGVLFENVGIFLKFA